MKSNRKKTAKKIATMGILVALAMICSYVETLIPIQLGVPGVKPGLANIVVFAALYTFGPADAFLISIVRIVLVSVTFGNLSAMVYSLAGGLCSFLVMLFCKKSDLFSKTGVSIAGGVAHNVGQLVVAAFVVESAAVFAYLPVLLMAGCVAGAFIGLLGGMIIRRIPQIK